MALITQHVSLLCHTVFMGMNHTQKGSRKQKPKRMAGSTYISGDTNTVAVI